MSTATRSLIATIAAFCAGGFLLVGLVYWGALNGFSATGFDWTVKILLIGLVASLVVYIIALPESVGKAVGKRSTRLTVNALIASLVAVAIGIVINMLVGSVPTVRADWTANQEFSISPQTVKVLDELGNRNMNVTATAFYQGGRDQTAEDLLKEYKARSSHFQYEFVDPYNEPLRAQEAGISRTGVVVFSDGKRRETANDVTERGFTSALVRLLDPTTKTVAFLTGHGERDPNGSDLNAYSSARQALENSSYKTITWSLTTSPTITLQQATVLVVAEPTKALNANEIKAIQSYLDGGGHLFLLLDPSMPANVQESFKPVLDKYGVRTEQGAVIDTTRLVSRNDASIFEVTTYPSSNITEELARRTNSPTAYYLAEMVAPPTSTVGISWTVQTVVQTDGSAPDAWLETSVKPDSQNVQLQYNAGTDPGGPVSIAVSVEPPDLAATGTTTQTQTTQPATRLVVFGDADWPSDLFTSATGQQATQLNTYNLDLFTNSVSWLAGANALVSIAPKDAAQPRTITPALTTTQQNVVMVSSVIALPLFVMIIGGIVWWRRR